MVRNQLGLKRPLSAGGLAAELAMLAPEMREALLAAAGAYAALGVPHALVGGLAAGAYGRPRFTRDIDFLVGDEAFVRSGLIVSFAKPMPLQAGQVAIDPIPLPEAPRRHAVLSEALRTCRVDETTGEAIPILDATWLAYMKLGSPRGKDRDDIVGMMLTGAVDRAALARAVTGDEELEVRWAAALEELRLAEQE
jgi:hypothetical protein